MWRLLKTCIDNESKTDCGEFVLEVCSVAANNSDALDLTSAVLPSACDLTDDAAGGELSFARFLSSDFIKQPFILASKERKMSVAEESQGQRQSTPTNVKKRNFSSRDFYFSQKEAEPAASHDLSSVWGSPLKVSMPADDSIDMDLLDSSMASLAEKKRRPKRLGIAMKLARKVISTFNVNNDVTSTLSTVLVLGDGGDGKKTAISGVKMFPVPSEKRTAKGLKVVTVTVDDKKSINEWNEAVKVGEGMSQSCQAIFNIGTAIDPSLKKDPWGTIAVEIRWKGANCRLLEMPSTDASTTIKASVHPGCVQSQVSTFYQELQFLRQIISAVTTGEVTWAFATSDQPSVSMTTALIESLQETGSIRSAIQEEEEKQEEEYNLSTAVASRKVTARKDLDFTDKLWQVLTNCMSTAELVASLRLVFKALGQGHLRPFVDRYNQTTVARLVRGALSGCFFAPGLTGAEPFVLLAEMGAEKLRRDYIAIFVTHSLSTPLEHLTDSDKELQPKLQDLDKLHNVMEMVTLLGSFLHLSQDSLSRVAQQMVHHYKQQPFTAHEVFSFPVKTSEVRCTLSSTQPAMWCAETTSKIAGFDNVFESSLYCLCANQPFFHLQGRSRAGVGGKGDNSRENGVGVEELSGLDDEKGQYCLVRRKESVMIV